MHSKNWMGWIHAFLVAACLCYITYNIFILSFTHWDETKAFNMFKMGILSLDKKNNFAALARLKQPSYTPTNYTCENLSRKSVLNGVYGIKNCWICRRVGWLVYNGSLVLNLLIRIVNAFFTSILIIVVNLNVKWENKSCLNIK